MAVVIDLAKDSEKWWKKDDTYWSKGSGSAVGKVKN